MIEGDGTVGSEVEAHIAVNDGMNDECRND